MELVGSDCMEINMKGPVPLKANDWPTPDRPGRDFADPLFPQLQETGPRPDPTLAPWVHVVALERSRVWERWEGEIAPTRRNSAHCQRMLGQ